MAWSTSTTTGILFALLTFLILLVEGSPIDGCFPHPGNDAHCTSPPPFKPTRGHVKLSAPWTPSTSSTLNDPHSQNYIVGNTEQSKEKRNLDSFPAGPIPETIVGHTKSFISFAPKATSTATCSTSVTRASTYITGPTKTEYASTTTFTVWYPCGDCEIDVVEPLTQSPYPIFTTTITVPQVATQATAICTTFPKDGLPPTTLSTDTSQTTSTPGYMKGIGSRDYPD